MNAPRTADQCSRSPWVEAARHAPSRAEPPSVVPVRQDTRDEVAVAEFDCSKPVAQEPATVGPDPALRMPTTSATTADVVARMRGPTMFCTVAMVGAMCVPSVMFPTKMNANDWWMSLLRNAAAYTGTQAISATAEPTPPSADRAGPSGRTSEAADQHAEARWTGSHCAEQRRHRGEREPEDRADKAA